MAAGGSVLFMDSSLEGKVRMNPEAVQILSGLPQPLKVVSVFGPRQSGKSHLLDLLVGSTVFASSENNENIPCIHMWYLPNPRCSKQTLVFLDCKGFEEDLVGENQLCSPMFTLSVLLSSVFLFNTLGPVKQETLDQLLHITVLENLVSLPSDNHARDRFLPEFVWCVRDVDLNMKFGDIDLVPADFLDSVLNDITDYNTPVGWILKIFNRNKMKLFDICPTQAGTSDQKSLSLSELSSNFIIQIDALKNFLYRSQPKVFLDGHHASGKELVILAEWFVESLSTGSIMNLSEMSNFSVSEDLYASGPDSSMCMPKSQPVVKTDDLQNVPPKDKVENLMSELKLSLPTEEVTYRWVEMAEPICLIENTMKNELIVNQEAINILKSISKPVVVVSIVGMYRTGKSYLMNRLAGKQKGFTLGSTVQSHTKGIWMWCVPVPGKEEQTLVLLDSEGLGDVEKGDQNNDHWIFALCVLLSSTLIYNSIGTINNDAVMNLHYVTELSEHIKVKHSHEEEAESSSEYGRFFPSFIWAVRDFTLELEADGKSITADEYLENSLMLKPGCNKKVSDSNSARECIRAYFPQRKCFVFDLPVHKSKLKTIDSLNDSDLDAAFVQQVTEFCSCVFEHSQVKTIKGTVKVTGRLLAILVKTYVDAIREGKVPCLENAVVTLAQIENSAAVEQAHALYKQLLSTRLVLHTETQEELSNVHEICLKEALQLFMNQSFKDEDQGHQKKLMDLIKNDYEKKCQENEEISLNHCAALLLQLQDSFKPDDDYMRPGGYQAFQKEMENLMKQYKNANGKGIKAEHALEEYLVKRNKLGQMILMVDKNLSEHERCIEEKRAQAELLEVKADAARSKEMALERRLEDLQRAERENNRQLMEKFDLERKVVMAEHERVLTQKLQEQNAMLREGFDGNVKKLQEEINYLQQKIHQVGSQKQGGLCTIS